MAKTVGGTAAKVEELLRPVVESLGFRLWDIQFAKEGADWFLRVLVDRDEPMDTDACETVSRAVDPVLDKADLIPHAYYLEVGSPGLGRRLVREEHFTVLQGQKVQALLFRPDEAGSREVTGLLLGKKEGVIHIQTETGEEKALDAKAVQYVKLCDDENLFG